MEPLLFRCIIRKLKYPRSFNPYLLVLFCIWVYNIFVRHFSVDKVQKKFTFLNGSDTR